MPRLPERGRRALEQLRLVAADASSAGLLAQRALAAIEPAVPFDDGAVFAVDPETLVFNRLLAYRGEERDAIDAWIRDVYLVAREPPAMHFPTLLARGGGSAAYHEDAERWLRVAPPAVSRRELRAAWRHWDSPAGGAVRYGLAHRRRWVAALQLARLEPGNGFRPGELELLDRAAPALGRALAARLAPAAALPAADRAPPPGQLMFDGGRRVASISASAQRWFALLDDGGANGVPVAVQAVVSELAGSAGPSARLTALDRHGRRVAVRAERALHVAGGDATTGYAVSVSGASVALGEPALTGAQWAVARGLSDREVAAALGISTATVHERVAALHALLGTGTRARLVAELAGALREDP